MIKERGKHGHSLKIQKARGGEGGRENETRGKGRKEDEETVEEEIEEARREKNRNI